MSRDPLEMIMFFYRPAVYRVVFGLAAMLSLISCTKSSDEGPTDDGIVVDTNTKELTTQGNDPFFVTVELKIGSGVNAFQTISISQSGALRVDRLIDPNGNLAYDSEHSYDAALSPASNFQSGALTFNFPITAEKTPLIPGTYALVLGVANSGSEVPEVHTLFLTKQDADLSSGVVPLNVILAGPVVNSEDARDNVDRALEIVDEIIARAGLRASYTMSDIPSMPTVLPDPRSGSDIYVSVAEKLRPGINIYFGVDVTGLSNPLNTIAIAGASPGPFTISPKNAIAVSLSQAGGGDGVIDSEDDTKDKNFTSETRLLAEALTHELFHYMGLPDSMQFTGNQVSTTDVLDSEKCLNLQDCRESVTPAENIMFPYPLDANNSRSDGDPFGLDDEEFIPRDQTSPQQIQILNRYVGVE